MNKDELNQVQQILEKYKAKDTISYEEYFLIYKAYKFTKDSKYLIFLFDVNVRLSETEEEKYKQINSLLFPGRYIIGEISEIGDIIKKR